MLPTMIVFIGAPLVGLGAIILLWLTREKILVNRYTNQRVTILRTEAVADAKPSGRVVVHVYDGESDEQREEHISFWQNHEWR